MPAANSIEIIWTALPAGVPEPGRTLRLSVHVAPRLLSDGGAPTTLATFGDYLFDWPAVLRDMRFAVRFDPGPTVDAHMIGEPSSELWRALFPADTFVRSYEYDGLDDRLIFSYPVGNVLSHVRGIYQKYALSSPDSFPSREDLWNDNDLLAIRFVHDPREAREIDALLNLRTGPTASPAALREQLIQRMRRERQRRRGRSGPANALPPGGAEPTLDFFQVRHFFAPKSKEKPERSVIDRHGVSGTIRGEHERLPARIPLPEIDFHQIVSTLGQYPKLQRELGLVLDLDVPLESGIVGGSVGPDRPNLQVIPIWGGAPAPHPSAVRPRTVYVLDGERFAARPEPEDPELSETGLLRLDKEGYELVQVDVDGAAIKAVDFSYNLYRSILHRSADSPTTSSLPALRSAGFSLIRTGNALRLTGKLQLMAHLQSNLPSDPTPALFAEDLLRGYRVDVWDDETKRWHSLHERIGDYTLDAAPERSYQDEGFAQTAVTSSADDSSPDFYLHEALANWDGWSLSAPKPGAWLTDDSSAERSRERASTELRMETKFRVLPASLPRLRFGKRYRMRVRGVDLAGNSSTFESLVPNTAPALLNPVKDDDPAASAEEMYRRHEPLSPPAVVLRKPIDDSPGESLERLVIRSFNDEPAKDELPSDDAADRHIAPPKGPWSLAEAHGMLDLPPSQATDPSKLAELRALLVKKDAAFKPTKTTPEGQEAGAVNPIFEDDRIGELPYLPDPIARGASLINLPGIPTGKVYDMTAAGFTEVDDLPAVGSPIALARAAFRPGAGDAWYDVGSFRLHVVDATGRSDTRPRWDGEVLTVYLPKAEVAEVPYSSFLNADDLELMGMWDWIVNASPGDLGALRRLAIDGRHWMITPRRTLVLVHAVQQPLQPPAFGTLEPKRTIGQTSALLEDSLGIHGKSTSKVDVRAVWSEWIDAIAEPEPRRITGTAHVCELKVEDPASDTLALAHNHNFGDTKYRRVRYRATATTRFPDYLPEELLAEERNITRTTIDEPAGPDEEPYRSAEIDVPSSARPEQPNLLYVVPAFRWGKRSPDSLEDLARPGAEELAPAAAQDVVSRREGGWLRVYLERPWYSSGDGELLGVLFWNGPFRNIPGEYRPYVTQWGMDPIWLSQPVSGGASAAAFKAAVESKIGGLTLDELTPPLAMRLAPTLRRLEVLHPTPRSLAQIQTAEVERLRAAEREGRPAVERAEPPVGARRQPTLPVRPIPIPTLAVAGHAVKYDANRRLWYADIHIDAGPSYYSFVRLALVRFQPISIADAHISRVVLADFIQLAPDRSVTITFDPRNARQLTLSVYGPAFERSQVMKEAGPLNIRVEHLRNDVPEELGWVPTREAEIERERARGRGEPPLWTGKITLPEPRGTRRYRVLIQEFEQYAYQQPGGDHERVARSSRLVYAHAIEL